MLLVPSIRIGAWSRLLFLAACCGPMAAAAPLVERLRAKPVLAERLVDTGTTTRDWSVRGAGALQLTQGSGESEGTLTLQADARPAGAAAPRNKRWFGTIHFRRSVAGEDWTGYNRLALKIRPDMPGWKATKVYLILLNEGSRPSPDPVQLDGRHAILGLENGVWNEVTVEIPHLPRDRVTGIELELRSQGHEAGASPQLRFQVRDVRVQRIAQPEPYEGWVPRPDSLVYSHVGYAPGAPKIALAAPAPAAEFFLLAPAEDRVLARFPVRTETGPLGALAVLDFSGWRQPGPVRLRFGSTVSAPIAITANPWEPTVSAALTFYRSQRCGVAVDGKHEVCHLDWRVVHGTESRPLAGGWHDAGDLSQGLPNTAEAVLALLALAERGGPAAAAARAEAAHGLEWILQTRFADGARAGWSVMGLWTDNQPGTSDDLTSEATRDPSAKLRAAWAEARAAAVLASSHRDLARRAREMAASDWASALSAKRGDRPADLLYQATIALAGAALDAVDPQPQYREAAVAAAVAILDCQLRTLGPGQPSALRGAFCTDSTRKQLMQGEHVGWFELPVQALAAAVRQWPRAPEAGAWREALAVHVEYLKRSTKLTAPYGILPTAIYHERDVQAGNADEAARRLAQLRAGRPLGEGYYERVFPLWERKRGHFPLLLGRALALALAGRTLGDAEAVALAGRSLHWVVGANPFGQSLMYGVGENYPELYSGMVGPVIGAIPCGIETRAADDVPYWPQTNYPNYREIWIHCVSKWLGAVVQVADWPEAPSDRG